MTFNEGKLPLIYILGAQKGGSSSLDEFLIKHPQLCGVGRIGVGKGNVFTNNMK